MSWCWHQALLCLNLVALREEVDAAICLAMPEALFGMYR
jgi:hypothetical protein